MQQAGTTDADAVLALVDDPNFTFNFLGFEGEKLDGYEQTGVRRVLPGPLPFSEIRSRELKQLDVVWIAKMKTDAYTWWAPRRM